MPSTAADVVAGYFDALSRRDLDAMGACWAPDGAEHLASQVDAVGPDVETSRPGPPRVPHAAYNEDTEQARASIRKLAALEPATAWPGHAEPVSGDVRAQLEAAASA